MWLIDSKHSLTQSGYRECSSNKACPEECHDDSEEPSRGTVHGNIRPVRISLLCCWHQ